MKAEQQRQEAKHKKQWDELRFKNETSLRELEQLQVSKKILGMLLCSFSSNENENFTVSMSKGNSYCRLKRIPGSSV